MNEQQRLLADRIDAALPQTQCTRCGEPDCRHYAEAIAQGLAPINRCPPGGEEGVVRLARITGLPQEPLDLKHGQAAERGVARIDETWCIGCTLCIQACPVDAIIGSAKHMHVVIEEDCTGCELCLPVCPVDCIELPSVTPGRRGWSAWSEALASGARDRYQARGVRLQREAADQQMRLAHKGRAKLATLGDDARKRAIVEAAIERARARAVDPTHKP
ncbi:MAG: electron transport complex subunit RsxB [Burkholderiales bacterium]|uniref:electron transport complex subunit RsxB n=1 Tax=Inhella sp. TaxID=1921806 RepID=UPI001AD0B5D5|nr:electron transport complex subunit RsxB [Burkholderiales bacterium]